MCPASSGVRLGRVLRREKRRRANEVSFKSLEDASKHEKKRRGKKTHQELELVPRILHRMTEISLSSLGLRENSRDFLTARSLLVDDLPLFPFPSERPPSLFSFVVDLSGREGSILV